MLIPLSEQYLDVILQWRNQESVRQFSFHQDVISRQEHYQWWEKLKNDPLRLWYLVQHHKVKHKSSHRIEHLIGVSGFVCEAAGSYGWWSFYLAPQADSYHRLSNWLSLQKQSLAHAFDELELTCLKCAVLAQNKAVLSMHKRFGFDPVCTYTGKIVQAGVEQDTRVVELELTRDKYRKNQE